MGLFNILDSVLDLVLRPLLALGYLNFLLLMSFLISLGITLLAKYTTDQKTMKEIKDSMKSYQEQMKQNKSNTQKMLELQKKAMQKNLEYMKHSFKGTLYTFIPIIIIFGWMGSNVGYMPIKSNDQFSINMLLSKDFSNKITIDVPDGIKILSGNAAMPRDAKSSWDLMAQNEGNYDISFRLEGNGETLHKSVTVTNELKYSPAIKRKKGLIDFIYGSREGYIDASSPVKQIVVENKPVRPFGSLSLFGWNPGWLGTYFISSIIFTMALRKLFNVH